MTNKERDLKVLNSGMQIETVSIYGWPNYVQGVLSRDRLVSVDLHLTKKEKENIEKLNITENIGDFEYRGKTDDSTISDEITNYLKRVGENSDIVRESIANLMIRFTRGTARFFNTNHVWIESRSFTPNNYFDTPRWHTDAKFFNPFGPYKSVVAIKGAQTRFGVTSNIDKFRELSVLENMEAHGSVADIKIREQLDEITEEAANPGKENATIFLVGSENAVVHSEPKIDEPRLFISVITGPEAEMNEWYYRMDQKKLRKKS